MIIEYRLTGDYRAKWEPIPMGVKLKDINFKFYSIRINNDRQYHCYNEKIEDEYTKISNWMMLAGMCGKTADLW